MGSGAAKKWQERWGGFVHPHPVMKTQDGAAYYDATPGMTLRDWFAGQIAASLTGGIAAAGISTDISDAEKVATAAYTLADAMIAARKGGDA